MEISRRDFMHIAAIFGLGVATSGAASSKTLAADIFKRYLCYLTLQVILH
jgi:hypothetical protein